MAGNKGHRKRAGDGEIGAWSGRMLQRNEPAEAYDLTDFLKSNRISQLHEELQSTGISTPDPSVELEPFRRWIREQAESSLFFFVRFILEQNAEWRRLFGKIHVEMAEFLTDYSRSRRKLLMVPVGHLKTTFGSHGLPLHVIIQKPSSNLYFPGEWGCDQRICLGNENELKAKENLHVVAEHLKGNQLIRWLWPHVCPTETKPSRWSDFQIQVPRHRYFAEPTVMAIGAETGFMGRHFSVIVTDDLAGIKAGQSAQLMDRAKRTQAALRSRLDNPARSIEIEIGTHQSADDIYSLKKKDPTVEVMCRSIEERDAADVIHPIWPEKYPPEEVAELRKVTDPIVWALWYMNKPVPSGYTALNWEDLREFRFISIQGVEYVQFEDNPTIDRKIYARYERKNMHPIMRLLSSMPKQTNAMDIMLHQMKSGMDRDQAAHLRDRYSRCNDCGIVYQNGVLHSCGRRVEEGGGQGESVPERW